MSEKSTVFRRRLPRVHQNRPPDAHLRTRHKPSGLVEFTLPDHKQQCIPHLLTHTSNPATSPGTFGREINRVPTPTAAHAPKSTTSPTPADPTKTDGVGRVYTSRPHAAVHSTPLDPYFKPSNKPRHLWARYRPCSAADCRACNQTHTCGPDKNRAGWSSLHFQTTSNSAVYTS